MSEILKEFSIKLIGLTARKLQSYVDSKTRLTGNPARVEKKVTSSASELMTPVVNKAFETGADGLEILGAIHSGTLAAKENNQSIDYN